MGIARAALGMVAFAIAIAAGRTARADESVEPRPLPAPHSLALLAGVGALGSPGATGGAFLTGLRLGVGGNLDLFARADVASLFAGGSQGGAMDTTWFALWVGVQPRLL